MGLFKTAARVAVASSVHGRVQRRQANRWGGQDQAVAPPPAHPVAAPVPHAASLAPPVATPPPAPSEDVMQRRIAQLTQLGELRTAGILTDVEFEAQKAVILAS